MWLEVVNGRTSGRRTIDSSTDCRVWLIGGAPAIAGSERVGAAEAHGDEPRAERRQECLAHAPVARPALRRPARGL